MKSKLICLVVLGFVLALPGVGVAGNTANQTIYLRLRPSTRLRSAATLLN